MPARDCQRWLLLISLVVLITPAMGDARPRPLALSRADGAEPLRQGRPAPGLPGAPAGLAPPVVSAQASITGATRVSVASDGTQGNANSYDPSITADGRYVAFASEATNLVSGDTNNFSDAFVHDQLTGQTARVSVASNGTQGNASSEGASISADGRYVAFASEANNLTGPSIYWGWGIFVRDRQTDQTTRISIPLDELTGDGSMHPSISADGRYVAFESDCEFLIGSDTNHDHQCDVNCDTNGVSDIFVHDRQTGATTLVSVASGGSQGNAGSYAPAISADGRYVAFVSDASNLVSGDTNGKRDVFVRDRQTGQTTRVSVASDGTQGDGDAGYDSGPSISADGRSVTFESSASNLVSGDTNGTRDIFVRDWQASRTTRVSISSGGAQAEEGGTSQHPSISADGRYVVFHSWASNLVSGDTNGADDVFVHDRQTGQTTRVSLAFDGAQGASDSRTPVISGDGGYVAFISAATNLVPGDDANGLEWDVFVHNRDGVPMVDLRVESVSPVQVLEGQDLVRGKATAVKVVIHKSGRTAVSNLSVQLSVDGSPYTYTLFYVAEPANMNAQYMLFGDNTAYPLDIAAGEVTKTIYFFGDTLVPTGDALQVSATVDYLQQISEYDEANNVTTSPSVPVRDTRWSDESFPALEILFFRADWANTPVARFNTYYQGSRDLLGGMYPVSDSRFAPFPSIFYAESTAAYRDANGRLDGNRVVQWMQATLKKWRLGRPTFDRFVATVPEGWFSATTTGTLRTASGVGARAMPELVVVEARIAPRANGFKSVAHEIGHSYGLRLDCEEYAACNPTRQDDIGNYAAAGLWVEKRMPIQITTARPVYCFMGAYANREFWIDAEDYSALLNGHQVTTTVARAGAVAAPAQAILAVGTFDVTGSVTLDDWYTLPEAALSTLGPGPYTFEYQDAGGGVLHQESFSMSFTLEGGIPLTELPFVFTIPYISGTTKIVIEHNNVPLAEKVISPHTPTVTVIAPNGGERLSGPTTTIRWSGSDADGETPSYAVLFSLDGGATWEPLVTDLSMTSYTWDISPLPAGTQYLVKVLATDGINTGQDTSDATFVIEGEIYLPLVLRGL